MRPSPSKRQKQGPLGVARHVPQGRSQPVRGDLTSINPSSTTTNKTSSSSSTTTASFAFGQQQEGEGHMQHQEMLHSMSSYGRPHTGGQNDMRSTSVADEQPHRKAVDTNQEFERLMDELQIPPSVRLKVSPLDTPMKESLLISFRAQAASQRQHIPSNPGSPNRPGHSRAHSSHPSQMYGIGSSSPIKQGRANASGMGTVQATPMADRHLRKAQSSTSIRSPSGSYAEFSPSKRASTHAHASPESRIIDNFEFIMLSTAQSPTKPSTFAKSAPAPPPMAKRYTVDGLQLPPCLPGDESLCPLDTHSSAESGSKVIGASKSKSKSRTRGFSFGAYGGSGDGVSGGKRTSWFGSRTRDASTNGHIGAITFPNDCNGSDSVTSSEIGSKVRSRSRPRAKSRASQAVATDTGVGGGPASKRWTPAQWAGWLKSESAFMMGVERAKTLRMLLRHESTEWIETFLTAGGYEFLLARLDELLTVEWRTEQHDDQLLYEFLRCIKALSTLEVGKQALVAHGASPFRQLANLLYSEKKPGDLACRQVMVELFHSILSLKPSTSALDIVSPPASVETAGHSSSSGRSGMDQAPPMLRNRSSHINMRAFRPEETSIGGTALVLDLLRSPDEESAKKQGSSTDARHRVPFLEPASELPAPKLEMHDFIKVVHTEKPYKTYLKELSDVCRDYYWIMCHGENNIWLLSEVDRRSIRPQAPSGATGGVEFEATSHFRLLNSLARALAQQDMLIPVVRADRRKGEAYKLHTEIFDSGMDRILATIRKASVEFYTDFHLELALYVQLAREAGVRLPYVIEKLLGVPPEKFRKFDAFPGDGGESRATGEPPTEWLPPQRSASGFNVHV